MITNKDVIELADQHPEILQKMIAANDTYAKEVGVVVPKGVGAAALANVAFADSLKALF